jgi:hypothetical protein
MASSIGGDTHTGRTRHRRSETMRVDGDEHNATTSKVEPEDASTQMSPQQRASHTDTHTHSTHDTHTTHTHAHAHTHTHSTHTRTSEEVAAIGGEADVRHARRLALEGEQDRGVALAVYVRRSTVRPHRVHAATPRPPHEGEHRRHDVGGATHTARVTTRVAMSTAHTPHASHLHTNTHTRAAAVVHMRRHIPHARAPTRSCRG